MGKWVHRLTNINEDNLSADCLGCGGRVWIKRFGKRYNKTLDRVVQEYQCKARHVQSVYERLGVNDIESFRHFIDQKCEICGKHSKSLHWDHNHETGEFRGWLCETCNRGIGMFYDNPELLMKSALYLEKACNKS